MSFSHIKGQDRAVFLLREYIRQSRAASSYLFVGPEGVGKKLTAVTLAKVLSCEEKKSGTERIRTFDSCDRCSTCLRMEKLEHPDLHLISGAADVDTAKSDAIKIDNIRVLKKNASLKAYEANFKFFIIDNAHTMTAEAGNALLKILEEPPQKCLVILISAKPVLLLKTIISRCRILKFSALSRETLKGVLKHDYNLDDNYAHYLSYFSEGRLGLAIKIKDTEVLKEKNKIIDDFCYRNNFLTDHLADYKKDEIKLGLNILAVWFRDIYLMKAGIGTEEIINLDRLRDLSEALNIYAFSDLDRVFKTICESLLYLEQNINTKLLLSNLSLSVKG